MKDKRAPFTRGDAAAITAPPLLIGGEKTRRRSSKILEALERVFFHCQPTTTTGGSAHDECGKTGEVQRRGTRLQHTNGL